MIDIDVNRDPDYQRIIRHILDNQEFDKIKKAEHHGTTRYEHSLRVSYYSYKVAKFLRLNYMDTARAGLLHDFFFNKEADMNQKERFISVFIHSHQAEKNAEYLFGINDREADIIKSHMFPLNTALPKYAESWIVNMVDKVVGTMEFSKKFSYQFRYASNFTLLLFLNMIK